jgi:hypothetical protein
MTRGRPGRLRREPAAVPAGRPLAAHVAAARNKRILVAELFTAAQGHDLSLVGDPAARGRFRRALDELAVVSLVTLPSAASRSGWDAIVEPPLPVWVTRVDRDAAGPAATTAPRVWPSALEAAGRIASRPDEHAVLERVADWRGTIRRRSGYRSASARRSCSATKRPSAGTGTPGSSPLARSPWTYWRVTTRRFRSPPSVCRASVP